MLGRLRVVCTSTAMYLRKRALHDVQTSQVAVIQVVCRTLLRSVFELVRKAPVNHELDHHLKHLALSVSRLPLGHLDDPARPHIL